MSIDKKPKSRMEEHLMACINGTGTDGLPASQSRVEELLKELAVTIKDADGYDIIKSTSETTFNDESIPTTLLVKNYVDSAITSTLNKAV